MEKLIDRPLVTGKVTGVDLLPALRCDSANAESLAGEGNQHHGHSLGARARVDPGFKDGADASFFQSPLAPKASGPASVESRSADMVGVGAAAGTGVHPGIAWGVCNKIGRAHV